MSSVVSNVLSIGTNPKLQIVSLLASAAYYYKQNQSRKAVVLLTTALILSRRYATDSSREALSTLLKYGAEARIYEKYFASNLGIATFRSERAGSFKSLTALSVSSLTRGGSTTNRSTKHVVFVSSTGVAALWAPAMARVLQAKRDSNESTLVTHAIELLFCSNTDIENSMSEFTRWLKRELRATEGDRVVVVAHGEQTCGLLAETARKDKDFSISVSLVLVNPLTVGVFPGSLPLRESLVSFYRDTFIKLISISRVLHEHEPPLIDPIIVEFAVLSSRTHKHFPLLGGVTRSSQAPSDTLSTSTTNQDEQVQQEVHDDLTSPYDSPLKPKTHYLDTRITLRDPADLTPPRMLAWQNNFGTPKKDSDAVTVKNSFTPENKNHSNIDEKFKSTNAAASSDSSNSRSTNIQPSNTHEVKKLDCEVAVVCGDQDWFGGRKAYEKIASDLGGKHSAAPVFLRGLGSLPHLEDPDKFAEALLAAEFSIP